MTAAKVAGSPGEQRRSIGLVLGVLALTIAGLLLHSLGIDHARASSAVQSVQPLTTQSAPQSAPAAATDANASSGPRWVTSQLVPEWSGGGGALTDGLAGALATCLVVTLLLFFACGGRGFRRHLFSWAFHFVAARVPRPATPPSTGHLLAILSISRT